MIRRLSLRNHDVTYLSVGLGYLVVYLAVGSALAAFPAARSIYGAIGLLLPASSIVVVILRRRSEWAGCQRLFWDTIAIGMVLWCIGHAGWAYGEIVLRRPSWLQWHTLFSLCGGAAPLIALVARPHRGVRPEAASRTASDIAGCALLAAFFYTYFVMIPSLLPETGDAAEVTLLVMAQLLRFAMLVALCATAWVARTTPWRATFVTQAAGVGIGFFLRIDTSLAILSGRYQTGTVGAQGAYLRAVLQYEGSRRGHRAWSVDLARYRERAWRLAGRLRRGDQRGLLQAHAARAQQRCADRLGSRCLTHVCPGSFALHGRRRCHQAHKSTRVFKEPTT